MQVHLIDPLEAAGAYLPVLKNERVDTSSR